ncbi:MAG: ABC transporter permease [Actinobacteria bacterium]|nr:ABC transporter permease [Actinomycetota bacterium]
MRGVAPLLGKDLRILARSPLLVSALVLYPLLLAAAVGLVARFADERPRVALVDRDELPATVTVGGREYALGSVLVDAEEEVELVEIPEEEAERRLRAGDVVAILVVPEGFTSRLRGMVESPTLTLRLTRGGLADRVERQAQALVYTLNRRLQEAYIEANLEYIRLLREGGSGDFLGNEFDIVGLERAGRELAEIERTSDDPAVVRRAAELQTFVREALLALDQSGETLRAVANPMELETRGEERRTALLSAQLQAYALALVLALVCVLVAAAGIAAERDENVIGRLARGLVRLGALVGEKIAVGAGVGAALGVVLVALFAAAAQLADGAEQPWERLPLLALGLVLAAAAFGAFGVLLGVLARETRTAALLAVLVTLPVVLLGLLPPAVLEPVAWLSRLFPFVHATQLFESALYDLDPWGAIARESAWLAALGIAYALAARAGMRRLSV